MAIYHLSIKPISRSSGRSAVAAIAYRTAERLTNERDGEVHDFTRRSGVAHTEIVLPDGVNAGWALDRSRLWNAAETAEKRKDARVAREIEVALPHELTVEQRTALTQEFAQGLADRYGVAVDIAIHSPHRESSVLNHHAHILMTTRKLAEVGREVPTGLGEKSVLELENKKLQALGLPTTQEQVRDIRIAWEQAANVHLARAGLENRIDHRSHQERGLELEPTQHVGVHATQMERRSKSVSRMRIDEKVARQNAALIREKPDQVLTLITDEKSVFDRHDVARALHRYIGDADEFRNALARVMASPALVALRAEEPEGQRSPDERGSRMAEPALYSTREMIVVEHEMAASAERMHARRNFGVARGHLAAALERQDAALRAAGGGGLNDEQRGAIAHVAGPEHITAVVGFAGAGKSTMLAAARDAWEAQGYRVHGAALSGKAAEALEGSAGIRSRTLASWERGWERGFDALGSGDVFVIDEAGMIGSKQLSRFVTEAERAGAKIVLVGDPEQLQPIGAGAAFRAVAERVGFAALETVVRQQEGWQRAASIAFGRQRTAEGLAAYAEQGSIRFEATVEDARGAIVRDVLSDMDARPEGSRLVLAHRRVDVQDLNAAIRGLRQARGELAGEIVYQTTEGARSFAAGDRVLFRENDRELGVKNGMLGTVEAAVEGRLSIRLDSGKGAGQGRSVSVSMADYAAVDHGYATTIHKSQGATVDRAYVLASGTMDRHMTYVAMSRHREDARLYAGRDEFGDMAALTARLSRSQAKETTLDYDRVLAGQGGAAADYAQRRGIDVRDSGVRGRERAHPSRERAEVSRDGQMRRSEPAAAAQAAATEVVFPYRSDSRVSPQAEADRSNSRVSPRAEADRSNSQVSPQAEAVAAVPQQAVATGRASAGRAGFRERYEAHKQQQALDAARHEQARGLLRDWVQRRDEYDKALPGIEKDPSLGGARAKLLGFSAALRRQPEAAALLRERGTEFGIKEDSALAKVLRSDRPEQTITGLMQGAETRMRQTLKVQAETLALELVQERRRSRGLGMGR